jgi:hypothetical protein
VALDGWDWNYGFADDFGSVQFSSLEVARAYGVSYSTTKAYLRISILHNFAFPSPRVPL